HHPHPGQALRHQRQRKGVTMNASRAIPAFLLVSAIAAAASAAEVSPSASRDAVVAAGMAVNVPLVARIIRAGPTLYISTVDVQNNTATATQVDWYLNGVNLKTSAPIGLTGSVSTAGAFVAQGSGGLVRGKSNAHFEDVVDSFVQAGFLPAT